MNILYFIQNHAINYNLILSDIAPYCSLLIAASVVLLQVKMQPEKITVQAENIPVIQENKDPELFPENEPEPEKKPIVKNPDSSIINKKVIERLKELAKIAFTENSHLFHDKSRWTIGELNNCNYTLNTFNSVDQMQTIEVENFQMSIDLCSVFRVLYRFSKIEKTDKIYFDLPEKEQEKTNGLETYVNKSKSYTGESEKHIFVDTKAGNMIATDRFSIKILPIEKSEKEPYFIDTKGFKTEPGDKFPNYSAIIPQKGYKITLSKDILSALKNVQNYAILSIESEKITISDMDKWNKSISEKTILCLNDNTAKISLTKDQIKRIIAEKTNEFYLSEVGLLVSVKNSICIHCAKRESLGFFVSGTEENINYSTGERKTIRLRTVKNDYQAEKTKVSQLEKIA